VHRRGDGAISRFPNLTLPESSPAECCTLLAHGDSLGAGDCIAVLDGHWSGLESRFQHQQCEPPPRSTLSDPPHSFSVGPTPSVATLCMWVGPYCISEPRLLREMHGWSHRFQLWQGLSTGTFFEKSISWSKHSGKSTFGTGSWFVDTFNSWCRKPRCQCALLQYLMRKAAVAWLTHQTNPGTTIQKPPAMRKCAKVPKNGQSSSQEPRCVAAQESGS
jgi:hypothetical protein